MPLKLHVRNAGELADHFKTKAAQEKEKSENYRKAGDRTKAEHRAEAFSEVAEEIAAAEIG